MGPPARRPAVGNMTADVGPVHQPTPKQTASGIHQYEIRAKRVYGAQQCWPMQRRNMWPAEPYTTDA